MIKDGIYRNQICKKRKKKEKDRQTDGERGRPRRRRFIYIYDHFFFWLLVGLPLCHIGRGPNPFHQTLARTGNTQTTRYRSALHQSHATA